MESTSWSTAFLSEWIYACEREKWFVTIFRDTSNRPTCCSQPALHLKSPPIYRRIYLLKKKTIHPIISLPPDKCPPLVLMWEQKLYRAFSYDVTAMNNEMTAMLVYEDNPIMFGIIGREDETFLNHILLLAKQYLYSCRQNKYSPSIRVLNSKINTVFLIETMIAKSH